MGLNSSIGFIRLQKLQGISQIFTWSNPIKLEQSCGHLPLVKLSYKISEIFIEPLATLLVNDTTNFIVAGGLTLNDFIVAAKIDEIKTSDLVPRRRAWA